MLICINIHCNYGLYVFTYQQGSGVSESRNTTESSTALTTELQSEEATTVSSGVSGSDATAIQISELVMDTNAISSVQVHVVLDDPLPVEMTAIEGDMLATSQVPYLLPDDIVACDGIGRYDQVQFCSNVNKYMYIHMG